MIQTDYERIVDQLESDKVISLLTELGADQIVDTPNYILTNTICHNDVAAEASLKLYFYKDNKFFYCYTKDGGMSIFTFLRKYYETRDIDYDWYEDVVKVAESCAPSITRHKIDTPSLNLKKLYQQDNKKIELPTYPEGILKVFTKLYPGEWLDDGISASTMDKFNILYSHDQYRIIIPHYNVRGELVGIRGRALDPWEVENLGKYMPVQIEQKWYSHPLSLNLYGMNWTKNNIDKTRQIVVFEAEKSVMQLESFSTPNNAVAICGSNLNKFHIDMILRNTDAHELVIAFDNEEEPKSNSYFYKLWNLAKRYSNYIKVSFIYDREGLTALKSSPSDAGEEIYQRLLGRRIFV